MLNELNKKVPVDLKINLREDLLLKRTSMGKIDSHIYLDQLTTEKNRKSLRWRSFDRIILFFKSENPLTRNKKVYDHVINEFFSPNL